MIKKILGIFILLIIIIFLALYVAVDKILIKNTISNIEKKLNLNINLLEDYSFKLFPKLSLLTKFDLDKENINLFIEDAEFEIYKNYKGKNCIMCRSDIFLLNNRNLEFLNVYLEKNTFCNFQIFHF